MPAARDLSLLIVGATGVTGRQAVRYMRERGPDLAVAWGIAGRNRERLEGLVGDWARDERPELVELDLSDRDGVARAVGRAGCVVSFAGPFARMAPPLIEACVATGNAYVDVTGEIDFAARMVERWHRPAQESGARIVQVCGFEALPFDLSTLSALEQLERSGEQPVRVEALFEADPPPGRPLPSDLISRGTFESLREAIAGDDAAVLGDPAALVGDLAWPEAVRAASPITSRPQRAADGRLLAPMVPSPVINPPVIQRTLALTGRAPIAYSESASLSGLLPGRAAGEAAAVAASAFNGGLGLLTRAPRPLRRAVAGALRVATPAGGPREDRLEAWRWRVTTTAKGAEGASTTVRIDAEGHPGYLTTSRMTTEAGLILADEGAGAPDRSGWLTPAAALGTATLSRFEAAGLRFASP